MPLWGIPNGEGTAYCGSQPAGFLRKPHSLLFSGLYWSIPGVMEDLEMPDASIRTKLLEGSICMLRDDNPDLERLVHQLPAPRPVLDI